MINANIAKAFIEKASDRLSGDWIIIGGTVLYLLGIEERVTMDIDIAPPSKASQMEMAQELGLPIEAINQTGAFFLHRLAGWENSIIEVRAGKTSRFYRPDVNLFIKLKAGRLTEQDLEDCKNFIRWAKK